jgi:HEPN domain-containing protein
MSGRAETPFSRAHHWLELARGDLQTAQALLSIDHPVRRNIAFLTQQAAEKAVKALFAHHDLRVPRTHDLQGLLEVLPPGWQPIPPPEAGPLTAWAVLGRYNELEGDLSAEDAHELVQLSDRLLTAADRLISEGHPPDTSDGS